MAVLDDTNRAEATTKMMRELSREFDPIAITKADLRAAIDAIDTYFNDNAATINNTLPAAAKAGLSTTQKAILLIYVVTQRYLAGA